MVTKQRYGKLGGNVAYHGYQSFKTREITPYEAHQIGFETAKQMWGEYYEIVVTTHLNTDNIHNHFVVNSVSFKTGRKFENHISDHYKLREISDAVCIEHKKSVLQPGKFAGDSKGEYWIKKNGGTTHRDALRKDIDSIIKNSIDWDDFYGHLKGLGYAEQTSKKIKAVWKAKAANGERVSALVPFGYMKSPDDPKQWIVDDQAAKTVKYIFELCIAGLGPMKIAKRLESEKIINPTEYYYSIGRKASNKRPANPYRWEQATVVHILENKQYTGCTVNFKTTFVSFKVKKTVYLPEDEWQIIPNTQEAIIDEDTFDRVAELRKNRRRNTATGRTSMFAGLLYCADCGSKLYFAAAKSIKEHQEFYRCSQYKENRGSCTVHYIRDVVLKEMVLEAIQKVAKYVVEYEPVFLYLFAKKNTLGRETTIRNMKAKIEKSKRRIKELDMLIERIYEDNVLGKISDDRFYRMSANYEKEQKELLAAVEHDEQKIREAEQEKINLNIFLEAIRECTDLKELTPTLVNTLIKRIDVHNNTKDEHGHKHVPIDIYFTAVGIINIPTEEELISAMEEMRDKPLKSA